MKYSLITVLIASTSFSQALDLKRSTTDYDEEEFNPPVYELSLPDIKHLKILQTGQTVSFATDSTQQCQKFSLSHQEVSQFFNQAHGINKQDVHYSLDWSPCFVKGSLDFVDGGTANWWIDQFRGGYLLYSTGEEQYLYCANCKGKNFLPQIEPINPSDKCNN